MTDTPVLSPRALNHALLEQQMLLCCQKLYAKPAWLGRPLDLAPDATVVRYLAAFGPATVR